MLAIITKNALIVSLEGTEHQDFGDLDRNDREMELIEYLRAAKNLEPVAPEIIGALTSQPLFADMSIEDDGTYTIYGPVFGFPAYQVKDELEELAIDGTVTFPVVDEYSEKGHNFPSPYKN